jgi:CubicO group peptidase (beta-lactamase class C family)
VISTLVAACLALLAPAATRNAVTVPTPAAFAAAADYSAALSGRALLVMVDGKVVHERYDNGWSADRPHMLASGTKSFTGVIAAAAIQDGIIPSWDAPVADAIEAWRADPVKKTVTVRHLLSLSSGIDPGDMLGITGTRDRRPELEGDNRGEKPTVRLARLAAQGAQTDHYAAAIAAKLTGTPGGQFEYGPNPFYAFGAYFEARAAQAGKPQAIDAYFNQRLAKPIGLNVAWWGKDRAGHVNLPGGMFLTAREWAKFGEFIRLGGAVRRDDGSLNQIVEPSLLAECFKPGRANRAYGLSWWLPGAPGDADVADGAPARSSRGRVLQSQLGAIVGPDGKPLTVYMAAGLGKQRLLVIPELQMVVVRFAELGQEGMRYSDAELLKLLLKP